VDVGGLGVGEPGVELGEGGRVELGAVEGAFGVLVGLFGGGGGGGGDYRELVGWWCGAFMERGGGED